MSSIDDGVLNSENKIRANHSPAHWTSRSLRTSPVSLAAAVCSAALASPAFARVRAGAPVSLSDVLSGGSRATSVVDLVVPLQTQAGPRILVGGLPAPLAV